MSIKYNNEVSLAGQSFQLLKSALQKCIRLGDYWGAFRSIAIMEGFHNIDGFQSRIRTNMLNRIRICYLEDISVANLAGLGWVNWLCHEISSKDPNPAMIFFLLKKLCKSQKIRFPSYVRNAIHRGVEGGELLKLCRMEDVKAINWGGSEILKSWWLDKKVIQGKERFLIAFHAIFLHLGIGQEEKFPDVVIHNRFKILDEWNKYNKGDVRMEIPIHAFDKHVSRANGIDKSYSNFVLCAAVVDNEMDLSWMKDHGVSKREYLIFNMKKDVGYKFLREEDVYNLISRVQLVCSDSKNDVYIAENKINDKRVIVKGPYLEYGEAYRVFKIMRRVASTGVKVPLPFIRILNCNSSFFGKKKVPPLGVRRKIGRRRIAFFIEWNDLFEADPIELEIKNSKLWKDEPVLKRDNGLNSIKNMNKKLFLNMVRALFIRHSLRLGDFAARNFIVRGDDVFLIDFNRENVSGIESAKFGKKFMDLVREWGKRYRSEIENDGMDGEFKKFMGFE